MKVKEANGISVYLTSDDEKIVEHRVRKTGDENSRIRMECYITPKPHSTFSIHVHLGRQKPWTRDFIGEPEIDGKAVHALHIRKRWHVTHSMEMFFQKENGSVLECEFAFGDITDPIDEEAEEGDASQDAHPGTIRVAVSRGEIDRVKPTREKISACFDDDEGGPSSRTCRRGVVAGQSVEHDEKMASGEKFEYDPMDRKKPFIDFVFKIRTPQHLLARNLIERMPAQQHPSQVSEKVRIKCEPKDNSYRRDEPHPSNHLRSPEARRQRKRSTSVLSVETSITESTFAPVKRLKREAGTSDNDESSSGRKGPYTRGSKSRNGFR